MHLHVLPGHLTGGHPNAREEMGWLRSTQWSILKAKAGVELAPLLGVTLPWPSARQGSRVLVAPQGSFSLRAVSPLPQVSHHPPAAAHHVYSRRGWTLWQEITIASKFRGKYLSIMPLGR